MARVVPEVIHHATIYVAEEMGVVLRRTARSPNIRDRRDLSCAVATPEGEMVALAEHIPVHLGSMAVGIRETISYLEREGVELAEGDVVIVNDPYIAGTHLNDIMLMAPVYRGGRLVGYVVNKAHHVDVGGRSPCSIGIARSLYEEGVVIEPQKLVERGSLRKDLLEEISRRVRAPDYLLHDLTAQLSSIEAGIREVIRLVDRYGADGVLDAWRWALDYIEGYARSAIEDAPKGRYSARDFLEADGELVGISATVELGRGRATVDFEGTHRQLDKPLNAVYGVTVAASTFALKCVLDPQMPMNSGFYRVVAVKAPRGSLVNPVKPAPVSMGNLETSQRIVDVVLEALRGCFPDRIPAMPHGSMNNVMFGGSDGARTWVFYETIGGGMGARPCRDGVDGVHVNMTNTLNTPVEVIEREYPLMVLEYSLRPDSGGAGRYRGGLGIRRVYKLLRGSATLTVAMERTRVAPRGAAGGGEGARGRCLVVRRNGSVYALGSKGSIALSEGDIIIVETAGGGGYGSPEERDPRLLAEDLEDGKVTVEGLKAYGWLSVAKRNPRRSNGF
ncbi:5-oxoprolinase [Candidatus Geothermarchaeota archaeon ex4572_27]|nr:MAG: 5-oxoprolinase [Candidatus Geothermarchaeota archaeon ex4572_27]